MRNHLLYMKLLTKLVQILVGQ